MLYGKPITLSAPPAPKERSNSPQKIRQPRQKKRSEEKQKERQKENSNPQEAHASSAVKTPVTKNFSLKSSEQAVVRGKNSNPAQVPTKRREVPSSSKDSDSARRNRRPHKVSKDSEQQTEKQADHSRERPSKTSKRKPKKERTDSEQPDDRHQRRVQKPGHKHEKSNPEPHVRYKALLDQLPTEIPLDKQESVRSRLTVESDSTAKNTTANTSARSGSSRLQFDGAIKTSAPLQTGKRTKEIHLNSTSFNEHQRSLAGIAPGSQPSTANWAVDNNRSNPFSQSPAAHAPPPASGNLTQQQPNTDKEMMLNAGSNIAAEKAQMMHQYASEEGVERAPYIDPVIGDAQSSRCCTRSRMMWVSIICCCLIVAAGIAVPCILFWGGPSVDFPSLSRAKGGSVVSSISTDICNEFVPKSGDCTPKDSYKANQGGELCNLLAKSMINTTIYGDIGLINAGICKKSLLAPELTAGSIKKGIDSQKLMVVELSGADLIDVLSDAVGATFGDSGDPKAYPYAAGLRYNVEANLPLSERLSSIEVNRGLRGDEWEPIDIRRFYKVITTEKLVNGGMGYEAFNNVIEDWKESLHIKTGDAFYSFALEHSNDPTWSTLPSSEYSTQYFVPESEEPAIALVPSRICHAMIPGQPESDFCSDIDVAHGGDVCNLLSWVIYDQNFGIDMVLLMGNSCAGDINEGKFVESSFDIVLSENKQLVTVDLVGSQIITMINDSIASALSFGLPGNYPYAAGLKFDVNTATSTASNIRVITSGGSWVPIVGIETYTVATTSNVFNSANIRDMGTTMRDEILDYAEDWGVLYKPPVDKVSTQAYF